MIPCGTHEWLPWCQLCTITSSFWDHKAPRFADAELVKLELSGVWTSGGKCFTGTVAALSWDFCCQNLEAVMHVWCHGSHLWTLQGIALWTQWFFKMVSNMITISKYFGLFRAYSECLWLALKLRSEIFKSVSNSATSWVFLAQTSAFGMVQKNIFES